jgi:hypothetical protein
VARDDEFDFDSLHRQLINGPMRWFSSLLAVISIAFLVAHLISGNKLRMHAPIEMTGWPLLAFTLVSAILWTGIAIVNWRTQRKKPR